MTPWHELTIEGKRLRFAHKTDPATVERVLSMYRDGAPIRAILAEVPGHTHGWLHGIVTRLGLPIRRDWRWKERRSDRWAVEAFTVCGVECRDHISHVQVGADGFFRLIPGEDAGVLLATLGGMYRLDDVPMKDITRATMRSRRLVTRIARALGLPLRQRGGYKPTHRAHGRAAQ